ncbi:MAG: class I SAM-dependent methyltransferase [Chloroflexota bacterium]
MTDPHFSQRSRRQWDDWAEGWDENPRRWAHNSDIMAITTAQLGPPPRWVLDAGCGSGHYTLWLLRQGYRLTAVDQSPRMVALTRRKIAGLGGVYHVADVASLPFAGGSFDAVLALTLIEWVADPVSTVRELARITRPGGRISLGVLGAASRVRERAYRRFSGDAVMNTVMPWEAVRLLAENGWRVEGSQGVYREQHPAELIAQLDERTQMCIAFIWLIGAVREQAGLECLPGMGG